jgi:gliding motility-associated-like protein
MQPKKQLFAFWLFVFSMGILQGQVPPAQAISTGALSKDNSLPVGALDANWFVAYGDSLQPTSPFVQAKVVGNCSGILPLPQAYNSNWITYDFGKECEHQAFGCIDLYFRRKIDLPATNDCGLPIEKSYCLSLNLRADNNVYAINLNGVEYFRHSIPGDPYKYDGTHNTVHVDLCKGWKSGKNTLFVHTKSCPTVAAFLAEGVPEPTKPKTFLGRDTVLCSGNNFVLRSPEPNTLWYDGTLAQTKNVDKDGDYGASYTDSDGCVIKDTISVRFGLKSFFPNAFSPNQDGINDCFAPQLSQLDFVRYELRIFDRYGGLVFFSKDPALCWDGNVRGKACPEGVFVYSLVFQTGACAETVLKGDLTLLH